MFGFGKRKKIEFLGIGDTVVDDFILLKEAEVHCKINHEACELCVQFGQKVPYEKRELLYAVGNAANAAVSAARLGLSTALVTYLGEDALAEQCIKQLKKESIDEQFVELQKGKNTNYHYLLSYAADRTILIKHEEYDYSFPRTAKNISTPPEWIYFSSVAEHAVAYNDEIAAYVEAHPEVKLAFQPNTFQLRMGIDRLKKLYEHAALFVCNVEEAQVVLKTQDRDVVKMMLEIAKAGPKIICITDGPDGAYMYDTKTKEAYFMPIYPDPKPPVERTGAGDAFTSTFAAYLQHGMTPVEALMRAPINSMNVVQEIGAQRGLLSHDQIEAFLKNAPADYLPKKLPV